MTAHLFLAELVGAAMGFLGALLVALGPRRAALGFAFFVLSNLAWMAFAVGHRHWGLLAQQGGFLITSVLGCWVWWRGDRP